MFQHLRMMHKQQALKDNLPNVDIKDYNVMIDRKNFFNQPVTKNEITYENIKIATGQGADYTIGGLLDYAYFKDHYKMIAIDMSE